MNAHIKHVQHVLETEATTITTTLHNLSDGNCVAVVDERLGVFNSDGAFRTQSLRVSFITLVTDTCGSISSRAATPAEISECLEQSAPTDEEGEWE